jgi:hypothetical protein
VREHALVHAADAEEACLTVARGDLASSADLDGEHGVDPFSSNTGTSLSILPSQTTETRAMPWF